MEDLQDRPKTEGREENKVFIKIIKAAKLVTYFLVIISIYVVLLGVIAMTCIKYNKWPIYTEVDFMPQNKGKFPAVTTCPISSGYKEDVLQVIGIFLVLTFCQPV